MKAESLRRLLTSCLTGAALSTIAVPASGQEGGLYVGASVGPTTVDVCGDLSGLGLTSCDDKDTGFKIFGGKKFTQNFAVEFGWVDLGEITATGPGGTARVGADGLQAAAVGMAPVSPQVNVFGKVGLYMWDLRATGPGGSLSDDGIDLMFGLGVSWTLARQLDLRAEWERFDVGGDDVDMLSVGAQYRF
jgi:OmpA-OmpF porin, OOP family